MMHLRLLRAAYLTGVFLQFAVSSEIHPSVAATIHLSARFLTQGFAVRAHISGVARAAVRLTVSVARSAAASASRLLHRFTITDVSVKCDVKHG